MGMAQKAGLPKRVALVSGNLVAKTCGLPFLNFEPLPNHLRTIFPDTVIETRIIPAGRDLEHGTAF